MTAPGFTKGPWFVFDHYCGRDVETAGEEYAAMRLVGLTQFDTIAEVRHGHDEIEGDVAANARLIAASPALYEALADFMENPLFQTAVGGNPNAVDAMLGRARAALAQARGETP